MTDLRRVAAGKGGPPGGIFGTGSRNTTRGRGGANGVQSVADFLPFRVAGLSGICTPSPPARPAAFFVSQMAFWPTARLSSAALHSARKPGSTESLTGFQPMRVTIPAATAYGCGRRPGNRAQGRGLGPHRQAAQLARQIDSSMIPPHGTHFPFWVCLAGCDRPGKVWASLKGAPLP